MIGSMRGLLPSAAAWGAAFLVLLWAVCPARAGEMRALQLQAQQARQTLEHRAAAEKEAALQEAARSRQQILGDRTALDRAIAQLQASNQQLRQEVEALETETLGLEGRQKELSLQIAEADVLVRDLVGVVRADAASVERLAAGSLQSALAGENAGFLADMADQGAFPGMAEIRRMVDLLFDHMVGGGEVAVTRGGIVDRAGKPCQADILSVGDFSAAYRRGDEIGFLTCSADGRQLYALSRLPPGRLQKQIRRYLAGRDEAVPVDISHGAVLLQMAHELSLWRQIPRGGLLVWPILAILAAGLAIAAERVLFLARKRCDADGLISRIDSLAAEGDWERCGRVFDRQHDKPLARVVLAGLAHRRAPRRSMEDVLQEAILKEIPAVERFLPTLGVLAAIAPLLGLLGTVTGMIDTFQVITLHGTGDARLMSGGISVALVTTMLGLSAAIPLMLAHALLSRAADNLVGRMEEKAVALVNIVHKNGESHDPRA